MSVWIGKGKEVRTESFAIIQMTGEGKVNRSREDSRIEMDKCGILQWNVQGIRCRKEEIVECISL